MTPIVVNNQRPPKTLSTPCQNMQEEYQRFHQMQVVDEEYHAKGEKQAIKEG